METRTAYLRRRKVTTRYKKRLIGAGLAGVAACVAAVALVPGTGMVHPGAVSGHDAMPIAATQVALSAAAQSGRAQPRRIYPFSIVPGGVASRADLHHMIRTDKVVAQHYATFAVDKAVLETVAKPRAVHVSYRKGDKVFWTAKTVMLAKGETVLTDGTSEIRGRCGNRISDTAQLPVEEHGPGADVLDTAMDADADADTADQTVAAGYALATGGAGGGYALQAFANGAGLVGATGAALAEKRAANYGSTPAAPDAGGWWVSNGTKLAAATGDAGSSTSTGGTSGGTDTGGTSGRTVDTGATGTGGTSGGTVDTGATGTGGTGTGTDGTGGTGGTGGTSTGGTGGTTTGGTGGNDTGGGGTDLPPSSGDPSLPVTLPWPPHLPNQPVTPSKDGDVPEPSTLWLSAIAIAALVLLRRKRARPQR